jgi:hypothetical protein
LQTPSDTLDNLKKYGYESYYQLISFMFDNI